MKLVKKTGFITGYWRIFEDPDEMLWGAGGGNQGVKWHSIQWGLVTLLVVSWLFVSIDIFIVVGLDFFVVNKWKYCAHFLSTEQIEETKSSLHKESQCEVAFLRGMQPN